MRRLIAALLILFTVFKPKAADWYVDSDAILNGSGTSWGDAFNELTNVVWTSINPGDTLHLSGGTYLTQLVFPKSGSVTAGVSTNWITVRPGTDTGHDGPILLTGPSRIRLQGNSNIRLIGWRTDPSTAITNAEVVTNLLSYTELRLNQTNINTSAILATGSTVSNIWISGIFIDGTVNTNDFYTNVMGQIVMQGNDSTGNSGMGSSATTNFGWRMEHNVIRNMGQDAIGVTAPVPNTPQHVIISLNWITDSGDDGIEKTGGGTIARNRIERTSGKNGHPDSAVDVGNGNVHIYGNRIYGYNTFWGYFYGAKNDTLTNVWIANNIFQYAFTNAGDNAVGITVDQTLAGNPPSYSTDQQWSDINFINNTFIGSTPAITFVNRYRPNNTSNTNYNFNVIVSSPVRILNNIMLDASGGSTVVGLSLKGYTNVNPNLGYGIVYSPSIEAVITLAYNILGSTNSNGLQVNLSTNSSYLSTILVADSTYGMGPNYTNRPAFVNIGSFLELGDYRLLSSDTAATGKGTNLTSFGLDFLNYDYLNRRRPTNGNWDIGALMSEYVETNLLVHLTFEENFTFTNRITDYSGNNLHAYQFGFSTNPIVNWPWYTNTSKVGTGAGAFQPDYWTFPYQAPNTNFWTGRYAGIVSNNNASAYKRLTNMMYATVSVWVKYNSLTNGQLSTSDHNGTIASGGYGARGAWSFGRYNSTSIGNNRLLITTNSGSIAAAPQLVWTNATYTNDVWNHYAFTADCSNTNLIVVKLYFNGSLLTTTNIALLAANSVNGIVLTDAPGSTNHAWLSIGAAQHNGTPTLDDPADGLPNNGFLNGLMDNLRIYDRVMSDSEILAVYNEENTSTPTTPSPPRRPVAANIRRR